MNHLPSRRSVLAGSIAAVAPIGTLAAPVPVPLGAGIYGLIQAHKRAVAQFHAVIDAQERSEAHSGASVTDWQQASHAEADALDALLRAPASGANAELKAAYLQAWFPRSEVELHHIMALLASLA